MNAKPKCSVIVVSYNTREMTLACLRSLYDQTRSTDLEVLLVDNNSSDASAEAVAKEFPQVRLFARKDNLGFAGGNNFAAQYATGDWLLLLNPDTVVLDRAVDNLVTFALERQEASPDYGIFGGRTVFEDRSLNPTSCWGRPSLWTAFSVATGLAAALPNARWANTEELRGWSRDSEREVAIVTGCFFLLRRSLWERLGGFDPAFFMYGEEADLCLRASRLGVRCLICPNATIVHYGGASEKVKADRIVRLFRARAQLFARHWSPLAAKLGMYCFDLRALQRSLIYGAARLVKKNRSEKAQTWRDIWRQRREWHVSRPQENHDTAMSAEHNEKRFETTT